MEIKNCISFQKRHKDHLGNVRQVTKAVGSNGTVVQTVNYYPFGAQFCDGSTNNNDVQPYKYNGKELDKMHGLNTYDYGARQYNPITARWDRMDPLAEKYYPYSPYMYCLGNPAMFVDPDGKQPTVKEAAAMAVHVYGDKNAAKVNLGNWQISNKDFGVSLTTSNGLKSAIYEKIINGKVTEYAYVTCGSETLTDWSQNVAQMFGLSMEYCESAHNAKIISDKVGNDMELTFIGHSQGGGEAALNSLVTSDKNSKGRRAMTFNAAGVSDEMKFVAGGLKTLVKSESKIDSYIMVTDPLNAAQNISPSNISPLLNKLPHVNGNIHFVFPKNLNSMYNGHSMMNMYNSIK